MEKIRMRDFSSDWHAYNECVGYDLYNAMNAAHVAMESYDEFTDKFISDEDYTKEMFEKSLDLRKAFNKAYDTYTKAVEKWIEDNIENIDFEEEWY